MRTIRLSFPWRRVVALFFACLVSVSYTHLDVYKRQAEDRSPDTQALLDSYGKAVDFIDLDTLAPIQTWLEKG